MPNLMSESEVSLGSLIEHVRDEYDTDGRVFNIGGEDAEAGEDAEERVLQ